MFTRREESVLFLPLFQAGNKTLYGMNGVALDALVSFWAGGNVLCISGHISDASRRFFSPLSVPHMFVSFFLSLVLIGTATSLLTAHSLNPFLFSFFEFVS